MNLLWFAVGNVSEHSGFTTSRGAASWPAPGGWTKQEITGASGTILYEGSSEEDADKALIEFLECDAVKRGVYCYTHNRI